MTTSRGLKKTNQTERLKQGEVIRIRIDPPSVR